jgi:hypothetical protein
MATKNVMSTCDLSSAKPWAELEFKIEVKVKIEVKIRRRSFINSKECIHHLPNYQSGKWH